MTLGAATVHYYGSTLGVEGPWHNNMGSGHRTLLWFNPRSGGALAQ